MKRWIAVAVLLALALWTANATAYHWWASDAPTPYAREYEMHGNVLAVVTLLLFGAAIAVALFNRKRRAG